MLCCVFLNLSFWMLYMHNLQQIMLRDLVSSQALTVRLQSGLSRIMYTFFYHHYTEWNHDIKKVALKCYC